MENTKKDVIDTYPAVNDQGETTYVEKEDYEKYVSDQRENQEEEVTEDNNRHLSYIPGTTILRPKDRYEVEQEGIYSSYEEYLEDYYQHFFGIDYKAEKILGTQINKPRNRYTYETDEHYHKFLEDYYTSRWDSKKTSWNPEKSFKNKKRKKPKKRFKRISVIITAAILAVTLAIVGGVGLFIKKLFSPSNGSSETPQKESSESSKSTDNIVSLIKNSNIYAEKKDFLLKTWKYLYKYNKEYADKHIESETDTKLALRWDEVVSQQLVYIKYSQDSLKKIFDEYDFDKDILFNAYKEGVNQEIQAYIVQTTPLNKQNLIQSDKGKQFYRDYETLVIRFNTRDNEKEKEEVAKEFYTNLRKDLEFDAKNDANFKSYKLSILPMVNAMNKMCRNLDREYVLSKEELNSFNEICFNNVKSKLGTDMSILESGDFKDNRPFEFFEDEAIATLEKENLYEVKDSKRDISDHKEYEMNMSWFKEKNKDNNKSHTNGKATQETDNKKNPNESPKPEPTKNPKGVTPAPSPTAEPDATQTPEVESGAVETTKPEETSKPAEETQAPGVESGAVETTKPEETSKPAEPVITSGVESGSEELEQTELAFNSKYDEERRLSRNLIAEAVANQIIESMEKDASNDILDNQKGQYIRKI